MSKSLVDVVNRSKQARDEHASKKTVKDVMTKPTKYPVRVNENGKYAYMFKLPSAQVKDKKR